MDKFREGDVVDVRAVVKHVYPDGAINVEVDSSSVIIRDAASLTMVERFFKPGEHVKTPHSDRSVVIAVDGIYAWVRDKEGCVTWRRSQLKLIEEATFTALVAAE